MQAELGPYTFAKHRVKRHVWFDSEGAVRFHEYTYHLPLPSLTNGSLDDKVTTLNIPLLGTLSPPLSPPPSLAPGLGLQTFPLLPNLPSVAWVCSTHQNAQRSIACLYVCVLRCATCAKRVGYGTCTPLLWVPCFKPQNLQGLMHNVQSSALGGSCCCA